MDLAPVSFFLASPGSSIMPGNIIPTEVQFPNGNGTLPSVWIFNPILQIINQLKITFPYAGEILSLCSAVFWALAVVMMKKVGEKIHPVAMNLFKNMMGAILIGLTLYIIGEPLLNPNFVEREDYIRLIVSGIIGIEFIFLPIEYKLLYYLILYH